MSFVASNWTVTYDPQGTPFVLVSTSDELDEEISFPWAQGVDTSKPLRAAAAKKFGRGAVETTLTLGVWKIHGTQAAARNFLLSHAASLPLGQSKPLQITVLGGNSYRLSNTVIASGDGRMAKGPGVIRTWVQYKLEGGIFTVA